MDLATLQDVINRTYGDRDRARGVPSTVAWLAEELGELAQAVRKGTAADREHEFADVLAWTASLANQVGVDLTSAVQRYADGCPRCGVIPCCCQGRCGRVRCGLVRCGFVRFGLGLSRHSGILRP